MKHSVQILKRPIFIMQAFLFSTAITGTQGNEQATERQKVKFQAGDRVLVKNMSIVDFAIKQEGHGGWIPEMLTVSHNMNISIS